MSTMRSGVKFARHVSAGVMLLVLTFISAPSARADDGYDLWLRYPTIESPALESYRASATSVIANDSSPTLKAAQSELTKGLAGLLGQSIPVESGVTRDGAIVFGTPKSSLIVATLANDLRQSGDEGYLLRS